MVNPPILAADKVQNLKNITEGDNYIKAIQDILITVSFPVVKLWDSILKNDENLDVEQVVNLVQQSLCNRFCFSIFKHPSLKTIPEQFN